MRLRRSGPAITRSTASWNSGMPMLRLLRRAARIAASFTRFSMSAPTKPGVPFAIVSRLMFGSSGLPLTCTFRIASRPLHVRPIHHHLPVEAPRPQQRRVQDVRPVRRRNQDHVGVGVEAVHLHQDLVQRLLALVVAAAQPGPALPPHRIDLVDEDDARRVALGLLEQVAHPAGADADEHLHELRAGDREERHAGLAGDGLGHQRLAGAGRADQQHALGDACAERGELLRLLEELDDLLQLLLGFLGAGHVGEGHGRLVAGEHPRPALAEGHGLVVGALRLAQDHQEQAADQQERQQRAQDGEPAATSFGWAIFNSTLESASDATPSFSREVVRLTPSSF